MPEGPEIALITRSLKSLEKSTLVKAKLDSGKISRTRKSAFEDLNNECPVKIKKVSCKGKYIWFELANKGKINFLGFRLGLVGKLQISSSLEYVNRNATFYFVGLTGSLIQKRSKKYLIFADYRNFGDICPTSYEVHQMYINKIGSDLRTIKFDGFQKAMDVRKGQNMPIAHVLLMQDLVSGIGNYMRAEALYMAKISPYRKKSELTSAEWKRLFTALKKVYKWAISEQITEVNYNKTNFKVYGKRKDPHGNIVTREEIKGRSMYWVKAIIKKTK